MFLKRDQHLSVFDPDSTHNMDNVGQILCILNVSEADCVSFEALSFLKVKMGIVRWSNSWDLVLSLPWSRFFILSEGSQPLILGLKRWLSRKDHLLLQQRT